ncbi:MAG: nucleotidyltransferase [Limisphaerales bacterium]|jgi:predicted nucleotidyltransferase
MGLFEEIVTEAQKKGLDFLVIGGHAVNFYGYSRETADLDLLVWQDARAAWVELFRGLGYAVDRDAEAFVQFAPPAQAEWPVDLMLVRKPTFARMLAASVEVNMYGARLRIPSLDHLVALKLHALKHTRAHRFLKDFQDVEGLVRTSHLDLQTESVRQLFLKYGNLELYEKFVRACSDD